MDFTVNFLCEKKRMRGNYRAIFFNNDFLKAKVKLKQPTGKGQNLD